MSKQKKTAPQGRQEMTGVERLGLRVSSMINHPVAQSQRWVTIHRLDTDGDMEWEEVMGLLAETPELDLTFNDDESVTVRWEPQSAEDRDDLVVERDWEEERVGRRRLSDENKKARARRASWPSDSLLREFDLSGQRLFGCGVFRLSLEVGSTIGAHGGKVGGPLGVQILRQIRLFCANLCGFQPSNCGVTL